MSNGLEGIPGSGKSYEAVVFHVLPALQSGRLVITNLPLLVEAFAALDPAFRSLIQIRRQPAPSRHWLIGKNLRSKSFNGRHSGAAREAASKASASLSSNESRPGVMCRSALRRMT